MNEQATRDSTRGQLELIEKAMDTTAEGITISDALHPDNPIIYANKGFVKLTGYAKEEVVGRNCRFLQGPRSDPRTVRAIGQALEEGKEYTVELLNYRKDGTPFWNRLSLAPIRDSSGQISHFVGIQSDITELKQTKDELEIANRELAKFQREITLQLEQAREAQKSLLPLQMPQSAKFRIASKYVPMTHIGGDFFDVLQVDEGVYGILVADVTGHGIHAALLSFMSAISFKNAAPGHLSTERALSLVNEMLYGRMHGGNFVAMFYAMYDTNRQILTYTQAGNPPGLLLRSNKVVPLATQSSLIGLFSNVRITESTIPLVPGDKILLYTDAIIESTRPDGTMLGLNGLQSFLEQNSNLDIEALLDQVYTFGHTFSGQTHYEDDFTLVGLEVMS